MRQTANLFFRGGLAAAVFSDKTVNSESHEAEPPEIKDAFTELNSFLDDLSQDDNNAVFGLACRISIACERRGFLNGLQYGAHLMNELFKEDAQ